jgi:hypothetical protein
MPRTVTQPCGGEEIKAEFTTVPLGPAEADVAGARLSAEVEVGAGAEGVTFGLDDVHPAAKTRTRAATTGSTR